MSSPRNLFSICSLPAGCILMAIAGISSTGCSAGGGALRSPKPVSIADFSAARPSDEASARRVVADGDADSSSRAQAGPVLGASSPEVATAARAEAHASRQRMQPGDTYIVDSLIGQINGRPIFADAFFEPIEDELRQRRRTLSDREFQVEAGRIIWMHLWQLARDELFLTEAEALLPPEQRQGLFAFMRYLREEEIAKGGGTLTGAARRVDEQHGMTIDERVRDRLDQELVGHLLQKRIMPRVIVSWRDVQREYRRRADEFNPPPTLYLSRVRVPMDDREKIDQVEAAIEADEPFAEIVERYGQSGDGPWGSFPVGPEGFHDIGAAEVVRERLVGLEIGETTKGFRVGQSITWLHLTRLEQESRSLYDIDVQRGLTQELHQRRLAAEERRYIDSLFRGIEDELNRMTTRLLQIAVLRYGSPES